MATLSHDSADQADHHPENLQLSLGPYDRESFIGRPQHEVTALAFEVLDGELIIHDGYDDVAYICMRLLLHHDKVAFQNARIRHGIAFDAD
jgi:hypothetical protein